MTRKDTSELGHNDSDPESQRTHHSWTPTLEESLRGDARELDNHASSGIQIQEPSQQLIAIEEQGKSLYLETEIFPAEELVITQANDELQFRFPPTIRNQSSAFHSLATKMGSTFSQKIGW